MSSKFEQYLSRSAEKWFKRKGYPTRSAYPYILVNHDDWPRNIILPKIADWIRVQDQQRSILDSRVHNGLSSQAMLFNLIVPLIVRNDLEPLLKILSNMGIVIPDGEITPQFEYENRAVFNEYNQRNPTLIDLTLHCGSRENNRPFLFIESKLKERGFGGCSKFKHHECSGRNPANEFSLCPLHNIGRRYWELLAKHGFLLGNMKQNTLCVLATHYQFFREVVFAVELGGTFVLLYDERNPGFGHAYVKMLLEYVPLELRNRVIFLHIQNLVAEIKATGRHEWILEFERKYGLV